ncbi:hypothetical protein LTR66_007559 [Elasticomyces elasticus]|nr:hypothetical protein LTR66_007559 [Elasticomyces elasticus]
MSDAGIEQTPAILNLSPDEKRVFGQLFQQADTDRLGVVTGEAAVQFFEKTRVAPAVLGEIWQIADTENRGLLTKPGFCVVLRLIGHYQAGRDPIPELAFRPGPLPKFDGVSLPSAAPGGAPLPAIQSQQTGISPLAIKQQVTGGGAIQPQLTGGGGPIRVPPLTPDKVVQYTALFERSGPQNGVLSGEAAKQIFEKAGFTNEVLGRVWTLSDTEQRGALGVTQFVVAMHLLASLKNRSMTGLPSTLPPGLFDAAARRPIPPPPARQTATSPVSSISRQFTGPQRTQSPLARAPYATPPQSAQLTGNDWLVSPLEKAKFDSFFANIDTSGAGFITGEQAVRFFSDSRLPEDTLATIWDLADIRSEGQLNREEFAVAMYLIRQQRSQPGGAPLPASLPPMLVPPSMRNKVQPPAQPTAPAFDNAANATQMPKSASEDLFGLDAFSPSPPKQMAQPPAPIQSQQHTGSSAAFNRGIDQDPFGNSKASSPTSPQFQRPPQPQPQQPSMFKAFMPTSAFGASITSQNTGGSAISQGSVQGPQQQLSQPSAMNDLLGDNDAEESKKLTDETTELANMSNQIGNLRNQMQEVQAKKSVAERDLSTTNSQKRDLGTRLSQFRSQYEQEVKAVKTLEEQLATSRSSTQKLQQELAMIEGTHQDLQNQHQQVRHALQADQQENATLKERISQLNAEISELRPQLDKMRSDARQQKGMVAISKKQVATYNTERDRMQSEVGDLTRAANEEERARSTQPVPVARSTVASPAPSTTSQSTNPFFRNKAITPAADNTMSPPSLNRDLPRAPNPSAFDALFGPSLTHPSQASETNTLPQTSFKTDDNAPTFSAPSGQSVSSEGRPTPSATPPLSSNHDSPQTAEASTQPGPRQLSSGSLPTREHPPRSSSYGSSARAVGPAQPTSGEMPPVASASGTSAPREIVQPSPFEEASKEADVRPTNFAQSFLAKSNTTSSASSISSDRPRQGKQADDSHAMTDLPAETPSTEGIPGAFPDDPTTPALPQPTDDSTASSKGKGRALGQDTANFPAPFATHDKTPNRSSSKDDFDSAFAGFGNDKQPPESKPVGSALKSGFGGSGKHDSEFPPIQDLEQDENSESESEGGFGDNFATTLPQKNGTTAASEYPFGQSTSAPAPVPAPAPAPASATTRDAPSHQHAATATGSTAADLPDISAQRSPPTYEQATSPADDGQHGRDANQFPREFGGLLPSREDPTSPPAQHSVPPAVEKTLQIPTQSSSLTTATPFSTVPPQLYQGAFSEPRSGVPLPRSTAATTTTSQPATNSKNAFDDDFDADFDDLAEAKVADENGGDDVVFSRNHEDEFNPTFDSPTASISNTVASQTTEIPMAKSTHADSRFGDFERNTPPFVPGYGTNSAFGSATAFGGSSLFGNTQTQQGSATTANHDWDAIFSGLDSPAPDSSIGNQSGSAGGGHAFPGTTQSLPQRTGETLTSQMPPLARAVSEGTEHDDPLLKRLTAMGYPRSKALGALERFDYDINKAIDHLTTS